MIEEAGEAGEAMEADDLEAEMTSNNVADIATLWGSEKVHLCCLNFVLVYLLAGY